MKILVVILKAVKTAQVWGKDTKGETRNNQDKSKHHRPETHCAHGVVYLACFVLQHFREPRTTQAALEQGACSLPWSTVRSEGLPPPSNPGGPPWGANSLEGMGSGTSSFLRKQLRAGHSPHLHRPKGKINVQDDQIPFPFWASVSTSVKWRGEELCPTNFQIS